MIKEDFLSYAWRFQKFENANLLTTDQETIKVFKTGSLNTSDGPDFDLAKLEIGNIEWVGSIEIHVKSSDWHKHTHTQDKNYNKVILHVVWQHDMEIQRPDGSLIPTLELKNKIDKRLIADFKNLLEKPQHIKCSSQFKSISMLSSRSMLERALARRLESKASFFAPIIENHKNDYQALAYNILGRSMGFKLNAEAMQTLVTILPYKIIQKHSEDIFQLEALLFGQAGLLLQNQDEYVQKLYTEHQYLSVKYDLPSPMDEYQWRYLGARPSGFPPIRIAQFAMILHLFPNIFEDFVLQIDKVKLLSKLQFSASEYWSTHYDFGKVSKTSFSNFGKSSQENIVINCVCILLNIYAEQTQEFSYFRKAIEILETLKPEQNKITREWESIGLKAQNAFDSQAIIEQFNNGCKEKKCLHCPVGHEILK